MKSRPAPARNIREDRMKSKFMSALRLAPALKLLLLSFMILSYSAVLPAKTSHSTKVVAAKYPVLIFDVEGDPTLPRNFRSSNTSFPKDTQNPPSRVGLDNLNASGSAQFTGNNLLRLLKEINQKKVYIIDLRKESHGFLDNNPVSWYGYHNWANKDQNSSAVKFEEKRLLDNIGTIRKGTVYQKVKDDDEVNFIARNISFHVANTEQTKISGTTDVNYIRFFVLDHNPPDHAQVDGFVSFVKNLEEGTWLHFHCLAGHGRTTTFMVMYDMIRNAKQLSFEDILKRQTLIGGEDLAKVDDDQPWQTPLNQKRLEFLQDFYDYVKDEKKGYAKRSFSDWMIKVKAKSKKSIFSAFEW